MIRRGFTQEQIDELKREINKTEYEKAREPLVREVNEKTKEIFDLQRKLMAYAKVLDDVVESMDGDYIKLHIRKEPIEVQFGKFSDFKLMDGSKIYETINVPIKELCRNAIKKEILEILGEK